MRPRDPLQCSGCLFLSTSYLIIYLLDIASDNIYSYYAIFHNFLLRMSVMLSFSKEIFQCQRHIAALHKGPIRRHAISYFQNEIHPILEKLYDDSFNQTIKKSLRK